MFCLNLATLIQNMATFRLYLGSKAMICSKIGQHRGKKHLNFGIIFNGTSRITHCCSTVGEIMMIGQKIRKWHLKIPS